MAVRYRKSIRLKHYDYSSPGLYFITICCYKRQCLFGDIINNQMILNNAGKMISDWYLRIQERFETVECLEYVVMPNHIHFILFIQPNNRVTLFSMIQWFKTITTTTYIHNVKKSYWKAFKEKLWQRGYYEHIIRNEKSYGRLSEYIDLNPYNWEKDELYCYS